MTTNPVLPVAIIINAPAKQPVSMYMHDAYNVDYNNLKYSYTVDSIQPWHTTPKEERAYHQKSGNCSFTT